MAKHLTWREIRDQLNELDDKALDKTAFVCLEDMIYRIEYDGGTAGFWPIDSFSEYGVTIDEGLEEDEED